MSSPAVGIEDRQTIREAEQLMNRYGLRPLPSSGRGRAIASAIWNARRLPGYSPRTGRHAGFRIHAAHHPDGPAGRPSPTPHEDHRGRAPAAGSVVEKNEVIGVVTRTDLINMFVEDPSGVPIPVNTSARERNLAKLLSTRLPQPMLHMLHRAGELGDRLRVSVYAVGGFVRDIMLSRPAVEFDDVDLVVEGDGIAFARALAQELEAASASTGPS